MSRIGKKIIVIPEKTEATVANGIFTVKGVAGSLTRTFKNDIAVKIDGKQITLEKISNNKESEALWGTYSSHISNMLAGVNVPFVKKLAVEGIGFKSEIKGDELILNLGFSHQVKVKLPKNLKVTAEKNIITISGPDIESVGQFAAYVRGLKKPEPYKGKGIRYESEVIRRKQGKKTA
jgi:large subunit ribosomal protein L6